MTRLQPTLFLRNWKKAVQDVNDKKGIRNYWEGNVAYTELKETGFLEAVLLVKQVWKPGRKVPIDWRLRAAIEDVDSEIRGYRDTQGKIVGMNSSYRQADDFLKLMSGNFEKEACQSDPSYVKKILRKFAQDLLDSRRKLRREYHKEFDRPWKLRGVMASILNTHEYEKRPTREDRLDTLFQIRLANLLRLSLPKPCTIYVRREVFKKGARKKVYEKILRKEAGISRSTIARLIVLIYIVGGLATETEVKKEEFHLLIRNTDEKLTVPSVEERLDRAGIE